MKRFALAVDLGGTKIAAARVDSEGNVTHQRVVPTPRRGGKAVVTAVIEVLEQIPPQNICAIGVDVPGCAYADGSVWAPNLRGWKRMLLGPLLHEHFKLPVVVDSDRNAFAIGEAWQGVARDCHDVIFLAVGTGIGAGIISGGRLVRGTAELSGCVGWMTLGREFLDRYKEVGCLESHLGGAGIAANAGRFFQHAPTTRELIQLAEQGNPAAKKLIREAGEYLGLALANMVSILNPQMIVIGGGVAAAGNLLLGPAKKTMRRWAQPLAVKQVRIVRSRLGERAALLGVAKIAFDHVCALRAGVAT